MKMWCLVSLPNSVVLEVELDAKALGQDCLNKVCQHLGIVETDFFGLLQVQSSDHHLSLPSQTATTAPASPSHSPHPSPPAAPPHHPTGHWLNLRNRLNSQLTGSQPYRLQMKVKFFVKPHNILQPSTRSIFLQSLVPLIREGSLECEDEELIRFTGLVAQAELGDHRTALSLTAQYTRYLPESPPATPDILTQVAAAHKRERGGNTDSATYKALQEASQWAGYGMEWHAVKPLHSAVPMTIGVGPDNIVIINQQTDETKTIEYESVQKATHTGKSFYLHSMCDDASITTEAFKLPNQKASNALYRCVTEMYLFYYCDTVRNDVASQFDRDIKGTLASLFTPGENKELGKKYVFDIQRTLQEAYDHNRRLLYTQEHLRRSGPQGEEGGAEGEDAEDAETVCTDSEEEEEESCSNTCKTGEGEVLADWLLCKVCCDADINTVFCPCGHVTCCHDCATKLTSCPLCRQEVTNLQPIFLPLLSPQKSEVKVVPVSTEL